MPELTILVPVDRRGRVKDLAQRKHFVGTKNAPDLRATHLLWRPETRTWDGTLAGLSRALGELQDGVVVHGQVRPELLGEKAIRRLSVKKCGKEGTILDTPSTFVCFDVDGLELPQDGPSPCSRAAAAWLLYSGGGLGFPANTGALVHWSASARPDSREVRAHVLVVASKALTSADRRAVFREMPVDNAPASEVQVLYTLSPAFLEGAVDPLAGRPRWEFFDGQPWQPPVPPKKALLNKPRPSSGEGLDYTWDEAAAAFETDPYRHLHESLGNLFSGLYPGKGERHHSLRDAGKDLAELLPDASTACILSLVDEQRAASFEMYGEHDDGNRSYESDIVDKIESCPRRAVAAAVLRGELKYPEINDSALLVTDTGRGSFKPYLKEANTTRDTEGYLALARELCKKFPDRSLKDVIANPGLMRAVTAARIERLAQREQRTATKENAYDLAAAVNDTYEWIYVSVFQDEASGELMCNVTLVPDVFGLEWAAEHASEWCYSHGTWWRFEGSVWKQREQDPHSAMLEYSKGPLIKAAEVMHQVRGVSVEGAATKLLAQMDSRKYVRAARNWFGGGVKWDDHPTLLNTPDGPYDFEKGCWLEPDPFLYLTKSTGVSFKNATASQMKAAYKVLLDYSRDPQGNPRRPWAEHLLWQCAMTMHGMDGRGRLIGSPRDGGGFVFLWQGEGGCGKSSFFRLLTAVLGDYGKPLKIEDIIKTKNKGHSGSLGSLTGARLGYGDDIRESVLDYGELKRITGPVPDNRQRNLHRPFEDVVLGLVVILSMNPDVSPSDCDLAARRRTRMLQWEHKFPASPLAVSGIREHLPGLAALIFKVAQEIWKAAKAGTPKSFDHEVYRGCGEPSWTGVWGWTDDFFSRDDPFLEWVDSAGLQRTAEHGDVLTGSKLWELFSNWCETNGYTRNGRQPFMSRKNFTQRVSALARSKTVNIRNGSSVVKGWRGLALSETSSYVDDSDFEVN